MKIENASPNYKENEINKIITDSFNEGIRLNDICEIINSKGYKTKTNKFFLPNNVLSICRSLNLIKRPKPNILPIKKEKLTRYVFVRLTENDYQSLLNVSGDKRDIAKFIRNQVLNQLINRKEN